MVVADAASNAFVGEVHEQQVCGCVDDFGRVDGGVIVLTVSVRR